MRWLGALAALATTVSWPIAAGAAELPRQIRVAGVEFVHVPAGHFWYTVGAGEPDLRPVDAPQYRTVRVWLDGFYIAKYEARIGLFERFMNSGKATMPEARIVDGLREVQIRCALQRDPRGRWRRGAEFADDDMPAASLSWELADGLARWLGFRLPTEAEWQKAARGPDDRRLWPWGNDYPDDTYGHFAFGGARCRPMPVNAYPKGRSPYGVYNMAGNVAEWVADWYHADFDASLRDGMRNPPMAKSGSLHPPIDEPLKLHKGGRFGSGAETGAVSWRGRAHPRYYFNEHNGVRFALDEALVREWLDTGRLEIVVEPDH